MTSTMQEMKFCDFCQEVFTGHRICCSDVCFEMREKRDKMLRKNPQFSQGLMRDVKNRKDEYPQKME